MGSHRVRGRRAWTAESPQRARTIVRPTGGIVRGKFPSRKNGCMVHYEGLLELDAFYLFEWSSRVIRFRDQPITLHYPDGSRLRRYTPDVQLTLRSSANILIEVKPQVHLNQSELAHKLLRIQEHLDSLQQPFEVLTDQVIRQQPRLSNIKMIYHRAMRFPVSVEAQRVQLERWAHRFPMSIAEASAHWASTYITPYCLLCTGLVSCDLSQPLHEHSALYLAEDTQHVLLFSQKELGF